MKTRLGKFFKDITQTVNTFGENPTAEEIARAIHAGDIHIVAIDERLQPWGNPRQAYPRSAIFKGTHQGTPWMLSAADSMLQLDRKAPVQVSTLFLHIACKSTGEAMLVVAYLRRHARRLGLCVVRDGSATTVYAPENSGGGR